MKTILIEQVSNGWIAQPVTITRDWPRTHTNKPEDVTVFSTIEELQKALPELLAERPEAFAGLPHEQQGFAGKP